MFTSIGSVESKLICFFRNCIQNIFLFCRYGIFIDAFVGSYLINILLERNNFQGAVQVAAELMLQEENNDDLVRDLSLLSAFGFVKQNVNDFESWQNKEPLGNSEVRNVCQIALQF